MFSKNIPANITAGEMALRYAGGFGWPVFPRRGRYPLTEHGWKDASREPDAIVAWWKRHPDALIAMPTGAPSGVIVLDIDRKNGVDGYDSLEARGKALLPPTPMVHTPHGGVHVYFAVNPAVRIGMSIGQLGAGLDVLGEGTSVALPTPGWGYAWDPHHEPDDTPLCVAPSWFAVKRTTDSRGRAPSLAPDKLLVEACARIRDAAEGSRHRVLNREAFLIGCAVSRGALREADALHELRAATTAMTWGSHGDARKAARDLDDGFKAGCRRGQSPSAFGGGQRR